LPPFTDSTTNTHTHTHRFTLLLCILRATTPYE
jgi:hypothetical protein